jgi:GST-like protein
MLDLYSWTTPNGDKIHIMLEETGLPYKANPVNIGAGEQHTDAFRAINRNGKIPAIVDHDGPEGGVTIAESGAILIYLAEKAGMLLPRDTQGRFTVLQWLMFQMSAIGPMLGQLYHFRTHSEQLPHAIDRFQSEVLRILGVLEAQLAGHAYIAGDYSIADIASYPWLRATRQLGLDLAPFPRVNAWLDVVGDRPAVQRGLTVLRAKP